MKLNQAAIGKILEEHIGNLRELIEKLKGTCWEQRKNEKNPPPQPRHPKLKRVLRSRHFECILSLSIGCMKFLFTKPFLTIFSPSPFLAWPNTPIINWGYLCILFS
jgi:hypothetical protein